MAARNEVVTVQPGNWVMLSNGQVSALTPSLTFKVVGQEECLIAVTPDATPPTSDSEGMEFHPGEGLTNADLSDVFRGAASPDHLWAKARFKTAVFVSHA